MILKKLTTFLKIFLLAGVLFGTLAKDLHGQPCNAKNAWRWSFVKGALFDTQDIIMDMKHCDFNYSKKDGLFNRGVYFALIYKMLLHTWLTKPAYRLITGTSRMQSLDIGAAIASFYLLYFATAIAAGNYALPNPILYKYSPWPRKLLSIPSDAVWYLFFKRKNNRIVQIQLVKEFLDNWETNKEKIPVYLKEFFVSLLQLYKNKGEEGLSEVVASKMAELKKTIKDLGAWV